MIEALKLNQERVFIPLKHQKNFFQNQPPIQMMLNLSVIQILEQI